MMAFRRVFLLCLLLAPRAAKALLEGSVFNSMVTRFVPFNVYKHRKNTDVAMLVLDVGPRAATHVNMKVRWWNIQYKCFCSSAVDSIQVKYSDMPDWDLFKSDSVWE